jgi:hypothetical protein
MRGEPAAADVHRAGTTSNHKNACSAASAFGRSFPLRRSSCRRDAGDGRRLPIERSGLAGRALAAQRHIRPPREATTSSQVEVGRRARVRPRPAPAEFWPRVVSHRLTALWTARPRSPTHGGCGAGSHGIPPASSVRGQIGGADVPHPAGHRPMGSGPPGCEPNTLKLDRRHALPSASPKLRGGLD